MVVIDRIRCNKSEVLLVKTSPLGSLYFLKEVKREKWRRLQNLGRCCEFDVFSLQSLQKKYLQSN